MNETSDSVLPAWGDRARAVCRTGAVCFGLMMALGWSLRLLDTSVLDAGVARWAVGGSAIVAAGAVLLGGAVWLVAEFRVGLRS